MRTFLLAALCASGLTACGEGEAPAPAAALPAAPSPERPRVDVEAETPEAIPKIAFLGDSLSAGLHVDADQAFPALLQERLAERGHPFELVNAGVSGDTTAGGLRRVDWLLAQDPDWVVVELGANDGLRGIELAAIEANLRAILEKIEASPAEAMVIGMRLPPNYGQDYADGFHAIFGRLAEEFGCAHVPFLLDGVGGVPELNFPDGIHPTVEGHEVIAERLEPHFLRLIRGE